MRSLIVDDLVVAPSDSPLPPVTYHLSTISPVRMAPVPPPRSVSMATSYVPIEALLHMPITAPSTALAPVSVSRWDYVRGSVGSPVCLSLAVFAGCIGLGYAGVLGAMVAVACVLVAGIHAARYRMVKRYVDDQTRLRARTLREAQRLRKLRPTGSGRLQHYHELRVLVEEVERLDPADAVRFELQDLLDHFVELATHHQRCADALRLAGAAALPSVIPVIDSMRSARRRDILQRRIEHRDECLKRMTQLTDELEGVDELIRLVVQRAASQHAGVELGRELERRLWELDEVDAAMRTLTA